MLVAVILLMQSSTGAPDLLAGHRERTRATVECRATDTRADGDVLVCARRDADRWRVPYLTPEAGDPKIVDVPAERTRLIAQSSNCTEMKLMAYGCGMIGVTVTAGGRGVGVEKPRPLAP